MTFPFPAPSLDTKHGLIDPSEVPEVPRERDEGAVYGGGNGDALTAAGGNGTPMPSEAVVEPQEIEAAKDVVIEMTELQTPAATDGAEQSAATTRASQGTLEETSLDSSAPTFDPRVAFWQGQLPGPVLNKLRTAGIELPEVYQRFYERNRDARMAIPGSVLLLVRCPLSWRSFHLLIPPAASSRPLIHIGSQRLVPAQGSENLSIMCQYWLAQRTFNKCWCRRAC